MLLEISSKMPVSGFMGFLKKKNNQMIYEKLGNARFNYRNRSLRCMGDVDMVGKIQKDKRN